MKISAFYENKDYHHRTMIMRYKEGQNIIVTFQMKMYSNVKLFQ